MPLPVIPQTVRVQVSGTMTTGGRWSNTLHFAHAVAANVDTAINAFHTELTKAYSAAGYGAGKRGWANFADQAASTQSVIYTPLDGVSASRIKAMAITGAQTGEMLPAQTCAVVSFLTASRGRRFRGRIYLPAIGESWNDDNGQTDPAVFRPETQACWDALIAATTTAEVALQVATYAGVNSAPVTSSVVRPYWGHQVSRRR